MQITLNGPGSNVWRKERGFPSAGLFSLIFTAGHSLSVDGLTGSPSGHLLESTQTGLIFYLAGFLTLRTLETTKKELKHADSLPALDLSVSHLPDNNWRLHAHFSAEFTPVVTSPQDRRTLRVSP